MLKFIVRRLIMLKLLVRVFDHDKEGKPSESGYFIAEPDELEATLTAYDAHKRSKSFHKGIDIVPNIEVERFQDESGVWITNTFAAK